MVYEFPSKDDRRKSRSSKRNNNNNNHSDSGTESGIHGNVITKKEIIDQVVSGHHHPSGQHMGSSDLASGLIGQQNSLTDSYIQPGMIFLNDTK